MLNYVNDKIPNNLGEIFKKRNLTISEASKVSGITRPTVMRLVEGEDCYLSKMAILCDSIGVTLSEVFGSSYHQENHAHDHSSPTMIGYAFGHSENTHLKQRIKDLETLIEAKDQLLKMYESKKTD